MTQVTPTPRQRTQAPVVHDIATKGGEVWAVGGPGNRPGLSAANAGGALGWSPLERGADPQPRPLAMIQDGRLHAGQAEVGILRGLSVGEYHCLDAVAQVELPTMLANPARAMT